MIVTMRNAALEQCSGRLSPNREKMGSSSRPFGPETMNAAKKDLEPFSLRGASRCASSGKIDISRHLPRTTGRVCCNRKPTSSGRPVDTLRADEALSCRCLKVKREPFEAIKGTLQIREICLYLMAVLEGKTHGLGLVRGEAFAAHHIDTCLTS